MKPKANPTNAVRLPRNYKSLVELEIRFHIFSFPKNGCFPCLKKLQVETRNPADSKFFNRVFSTCPVLEDLYMYGHFEGTDTGEDGHVFRISVPTLKRLKLDLFLEQLGYASGVKHTFIIQTPNLERLTIWDNCLAHFVIEEIPTLLEAELSIGITKNFYKNQMHLKDEKLRDRLVLILQGIRHARSLFIHPATYAALSLVYTDDLLPTFPSMLRLTLDIDCVNAWKLLPCFLRNSRILQYLKLRREIEELFNEAVDEEDIDEEDYFGWEPPNFEPYISPHLKEIEMENLWRSEDEKKVVNYLMTNAQNLEKLCRKFCERFYY